jgi:hypothetical protein
MRTCAKRGKMIVVATLKAKGGKEGEMEKALREMVSKKFFNLLGPMLDGKPKIDMYDEIARIKG